MGIRGLTSRDTKNYDSSVLPSLGHRSFMPEYPHRSVFLLFIGDLTSRKPGTESLSGVPPAQRPESGQVILVRLSGLGILVRLSYHQREGCVTVRSSPGKGRSATRQTVGATRPTRARARWSVASKTSLQGSHTTRPSLRTFREDTPNIRFMGAHAVARF